MPAPSIWLTRSLAGVAVVTMVTACLGPGSRGAQSRAGDLFATHCAVCHGTGGTGLGELPRATLWPPARDFTSGLFSLVSAANGVPTEADLADVIRRGMPGSAMPGFGWLPDEAISDLATFVQRLGVDGAADRLIVHEHLAASTAREQARQMFAAQGPVGTPAIRDVPQEALTRGRIIYERRCAACHHETGIGRRPVANWAGGLSIHWARDFTAGILKGGATDRALARRIQAGMPASGMPPTVLREEADLVALIAYVKTLIPAGSSDRLVQRRETITARKIAAEAPDSVADPRWDTVAATDLVLSPLRWRTHPIVRAQLRAVHDGAVIRILVRWRDESRDDPVVGESGGSDRVALQFSDDPEPGFFGMGSDRDPVRIWYRHPRATKDELGLLDLLGRRPPHSRMTDVSPIVRLPVRARALVARGHQSARRFGTQDRTLLVQAKWRDGVSADGVSADGVSADGVSADGVSADDASADDVSADKGWAVMFERPLKPESAEGIRLRSGMHLKIALAIWDGESGHSNGDKSFTIWHVLRVE